MISNRTWVLLVFVLLLLSANARAEEKLLKDGNEYVGWEFPNYFVNCHFEKMEKNGAKIIPTSERCPRRPEPASPGPIPTTVQGTLVSVDAPDQTITLVDKNGVERKLFVPTSSKWIFNRLKSGQKIKFKIGPSGPSKEGDRIDFYAPVEEKGAGSLDSPQPLR